MFCADRVGRLQGEWKLRSERFCLQLLRLLPAALIARLQQRRRRSEVDTRGTGLHIVRPQASHAQQRAAYRCGDSPLTLRAPTTLQRCLIRCLRSRADTAWNSCALSEEPLGSDVVACGLGQLYNREAVLEHLLARRGLYASELAEFQARSHAASAHRDGEHNSTSKGHGGREILTPSPAPLSQLANRIERASMIAHLRSTKDVFSVTLTPASNDPVRGSPAPASGLYASGHTQMRGPCVARGYGTALSSLNAPGPRVSSNRRALLTILRRRAAPGGFALSRTCPSEGCLSSPFGPAGTWLPSALRKRLAGRPAPSAVRTPSEQCLSTQPRTWCATPLLSATQHRRLSAFCLLVCDTW